MAWTKPRALRRGDLVGVCSPSSPSEPEKLEKGVAELRAMGFEAVAINATAIFQAGARSVDAMIDALAALHGKIRAAIG